MPTNAARLNYLQIREQQQLNRERTREAEVEKKRAGEFFRRQKAQYDHVQSHGYGQRAGEGKCGDVEIKVFVRECDGDRAQTFSFMESSAVQHTRDTGQNVLQRPAQRLPNISPQARGRQQLSVNATSAPLGAVPKYLVQRKAELAAKKEEALREAERQKEVAKYPPGHRPVTEEERKETLERLAIRRKELQFALHKIPIRYDTQASKQRRNKIEAELSEIDEAERKFSMAKQLFVPI